MIGQSYYPWWHGSLDDLRENLAFTSNRYGKDIYLVEVAYNWKPAEYATAPVLTRKRRKVNNNSSKK